jgi:hypothetical protein
MDPIAQIGAANTQSSAAERTAQCRAEQDMANITDCDIAQPGARLTPAVPAAPEPPPTMNINSAAHLFSDRMKNGFYMKELQRLIVLSAEDNDNVTPGQKTAMMMDVHERIGVSKLVSKIATDLSQTLQTVVTKSG